jgi:hypothetical protein
MGIIIPITHQLVHQQHHQPVSQKDLLRQHGRQQHHQPVSQKDLLHQLVHPHQAIHLHQHPGRRDHRVLRVAEAEVTEVVVAEDDNFPATGSQLRFGLVSLMIL